MKDVSVIIVNYNTTGMLCNALASVYQHTRDVNYEVIVVDNASREDTLQIIKKYPEVRLIALSKNIGFGRANNEGIRVAQGRNIFLLNPDTLLLNNAIKILSDYLDTHSRVGVCGGNLFSADMHPVTSYEKRLPSLWLAWGECMHICNPGKDYFNRTGKPQTVGYITGADMMIRRDVLESVGCFDPDFFMYAEETELTYRIRKAGYISVSVPDAEIIHLEGQSFEFSEKRTRMQYEGRRLYFRKRYGLIGARLFTFLTRIKIVGYIFVFQLQKRYELVENWKQTLPLITWK